MRLKTIPIGMVGIDNNSMRAYLAIMKKNGLQPRTIIFLKKELLGKKFKIINAIFGEKIARGSLSIFQEYIKRRQYGKFSKLFSRHLNVGEIFFLSPNFSKSCQLYSEIITNNINDPKVVRAIKSSKENVFIYGGGGIVGPDLFDLGIKFIHTHPGYLPFVRGSHGVHWSLLIRNKFGCTTFYMNKGIDTGDIILRKEYDLSDFMVQSVDVIKADQLLFFFVDPLIRAMTLMDVLASNDNYFDLQHFKQDNAEGEAYYSMHSMLRHQVVKKIMQS